MKRFYISFLAASLTLHAVAQQPEWCKKLPRPAYAKLERVQIADSWFEVYKIRPGVLQSMSRINWKR
jgi:hypothetical protein